MKRVFFTLIAVILSLVNIPLTARASEAASLTSSQVLKITFQSQSLNRKMPVNIYLPPGYTSSKRYPVLYMLHGYGGNQNEMQGMGVYQDADQLIAQHKIEPLIIVAPYIANSWGVNSLQYTMISPTDPYKFISYGMFEDYIEKDVIGYVDKHYSTIANKSGRYICGFSMGGSAALFIAFTHPTMFSKVGGDAPGLYLHAMDNPQTYSLLYPTPALKKQRDPIYLAQHSKNLKSLNVYLDVGAQDDYKFYQGTEVLYNALKKSGVQVQYHLNQGRHLAIYWESHINDYLQFYAGLTSTN